MGAYSPAPVVDTKMSNRIMDEIIFPTIQGMARDGNPYKGVLFAGLMITETGPRLIEYNARFGDPECQAVMSRLNSDLLELLLAAVDGRLDKVELKWSKDSALTVVMAANGYPGDYKKGATIRGIEIAEKISGVKVFHAGTQSENGNIIAIGGRVLGVTATGKTIEDAQKNAYDAVAKIDWPHGFNRTDIGWRAINRG